MLPAKKTIYDYPNYYDLIFNFDSRHEVNFLKEMFQRHVDGPTRRLFEPACGTGRLLYRLAKAGYQVQGNDLNGGAVEFCNQRLKRHGFPASAMVGDMTDFRLNRKVDAAFNTINSFRHLSSEDAALRHLKCMASAVRVGGIYVLGIHLTPTIGKPAERERWSLRRGRLEVKVSMWLVERNLKRRSEKNAIKLTLQTPSERKLIRDTLTFRTYTLKQFRSLLNKVPEFEIAAVHNFHYQSDAPISLGPRSEDAVFVLKRLKK